MTEQPDKPKAKPRAKVPTEDVLMPPVFDKADAVALKALSAGTANEGEQRRALDWIIRMACVTYDEPYRSERPYDTAFACGRAYAGRRILYLINDVKPGQME